MHIQALPSQRFIRKTELQQNEYRKHFRQIDDDVIAAVTSPEADSVTPLMSKIYLRLASAPQKYWERPGVLRFEAELIDGKQVASWKALCKMLGVASATANKAITWMSEQGIIGYFSGKNGVGLRIFLNRAASSIGIKPVPGGKKILDFLPASSGDARASRNEAALKDTYGNLDSSDLNANCAAPENGANHSQPDEISPDQNLPGTEARQVSRSQDAAEPPHASGQVFPRVDEIIKRLKAELEPALRDAAAQAAAQAVAREHELTREWLENRGLPKAARVAQREAFNILKRHGLLKDSERSVRTSLMVGQHPKAPDKTRLLTPDGLREVAEICVSMLESHGQAVEITLAQASAEAGGYLCAEDAPKVRELVEQLTRQKE